MMEESTTESSAARKIVPVAIGILLTCVLLALIGYLDSRREDAMRRLPPALTVLRPVTGASVDSPLVVRFRSAEPIELRPSGWGLRTLHLHAMINGTAIMPAAADIVRAGAQTYDWTFAVAPGDLRIVLMWADAAHRPLSGGSSDTIAVSLQPD